MTDSCGIAKCNHIAGRKLAYVPILRAGLGMVDGCVSLVPAARIGTNASFLPAMWLHFAIPQGV